MNKLDQPLKVKHGLVAVAAALTLGIAGTAIPMATAGGGGGGNLLYRSDAHQVSANSQASERVRCPAGTHVVGHGTFRHSALRSRRRRDGQLKPPIRRWRRKQQA